MSARGKNHWIKLYVEINDDAKVGLLPVNVKWRFVSCLALAGELNEGGFLPPVDDLLAYRLRSDIETLNAEMRILSNRELAELRTHPDGTERWFLTNFEKRQEPVSTAERQRQWRKRNADSNDDVTKRYDGVTKKQKQNTETETEGDRAREATAQTAAVSPSPLIVKTQSADRTPEGFRATNGYHPPEEPPTPESRTPPPEVQAIGEMANAITDVTGVSAKLNWPDVGGLAEELVTAGYTPEELRTHYGREPTAGGLWHWYEADWRGKKGERPRLKEIRETIAGAVHQGKPAAVPKRPAWQIAAEMLDEKRKKMGLAPAGAT